MTQRPNMTTAARRLVEAGCADLHVSMPARVESYDAATRRASV